MSVIEFAQTLIRTPSISPEDLGCQTLIAKKLKEAGFTCETLNKNDVSNLYAVHGTEGPTLLLAGHTDVVPSGNEKHWKHDPFSAEIQDNVLYGRGAADMKGSLAAMVTAAMHFVKHNPDHPGRIAFLITSDEEGQAIDGTSYAVDTLIERGEQFDYCIIGEASSDETLGDQIRHGRRGSLSANITITGKQGHVAYAERTRNILHDITHALNDLLKQKWDQSKSDFPETSMQITTIDTRNTVTNVIPEKCTLHINWRYSPATSFEAIETLTNNILTQHGVKFLISWNHSAKPFYTPPGKLTDVVSKVLNEHFGKNPTLSVGGGTSDGRFIAKTGAEIVEFGAVNQSIHQSNEHISCEDLEKLVSLYHDMIRGLFY